MKELLPKILHSKEVRKLLENFFSLSILKLINAILPFVTLPYLIKVLGFEQYGAIVLALSLIAYFQSITDYGFNLSATREIAEHCHSKKQISLIYSKTILSKSLLLILSLSVLLILVFSIEQFRQDKIIYLLMCLVLIGQTFFPEWFFRGIEQMRYITLLDLFVKSFFTIGIFFLVKSSKDYWIYPLLFAGGYLFIALLSHWIILKRFNINFKLIKISKVIYNLKCGFPLFINQFMPNFYNNSTNFLIGFLLGKYEIGIFGAIRQFVNILNVLNSIVSIVIFPYLVRNKEKFYKFSKIYILTFIFITILLITIHSYIFKWVGIIDTNASFIFIILIFGVTSIMVYSVYSTNYLISRGHDKIVMKITFNVSLIGLFTSYPLIKYFGIIGGAFNILIAQFSLGFISYLYYLNFEYRRRNS